MNNDALLNLIAAAEADTATILTITREDGSIVRFPKGYGRAKSADGNFAVNAVPVQARTTIRRPHYRITFEVMRDGRWKTVSRAAFVAAALGQESDAAR